MRVACSTTCRLLLPLRSRNPVMLIAAPSCAAASNFASVSNATAASSQSTLRAAPASCWEDWCETRNFTIGTPAGVYLKASSSMSLARRTIRLSSTPRTGSRYAVPASAAGFAGSAAGFGSAAALGSAVSRGASTDFAFSSFIIGEGVIQARSIFTIR